MSRLRCQGWHRGDGGRWRDGWRACRRGCDRGRERRSKRWHLHQHWHLTRYRLYRADGARGAQTLKTPQQARADQQCQEHNHHQADSYQDRPKPLLPEPLATMRAHCQALFAQRPTGPTPHAPRPLLGFPTLRANELPLKYLCPTTATSLQQTFPTEPSNCG